MRELINLFESVGLANRKPGARFANSDGNEIIFSDLEFFPEQGAYPTADDLNAAISMVARKAGITPDQIIWTNQPRGTLAFGIAHFVDDENKDYYFGRYFRLINLNKLENYFPNDLPGGYRLQSKSAKKERSGYKPSEILTKFDNLTPNDILSQIVAKFGESSDEVIATQLFMQATSFPIQIPRGKIDFAAFTNYFCELLQPMALVMGKPVTGNAKEAENKFLGAQGFTSCNITFGTSTAEGLTDSTLTNPEGRALGVSSKAKSGAKASAANLYNKVQEMMGTADGHRLLDKFDDEVDILTTIAKSGYIDGPLNLAIKYKLITPEEAAMVKSIRKLPPQEVVGTGMLSKNLEKLYQGRTAADPSRQIPFFHLLAAIAYKVVDQINNHTNFRSAASTILNHGAFIQVYTHAKQKGNNIILEAFDVHYPSQAVTDVLLSAEKGYFSSGNRGIFVFKILKNGATESEVDVEDKKTDTKPDVDLDKLDRARTSIKASSASAQADADDQNILGRKRR